MSGLSEAPALPSVFSFTDARRRGLSERAIRRLVADGLIEQIGRGLFCEPDLDADPDLLEAAVRSARTTICLVSALARHGLVDDIPVRVELALPREMRQPSVSVPVRWHRFDPQTFDIGRELLDIGAGYRIGLYSPERSLCDAFRLRHLYGSDLAIGALKQWLQKSGSQPSTLLDVALSLGPKAAGPVRSALQILL